MKREIEPLPPDVAGLLARGSAMAEPPAQVRARLRERLAIGLAGPVAVGPAASPWTRFQGLTAAAAGSRAFIGLVAFLAGAATVLALRSSPLASPTAATSAAAAPLAAVNAPAASDADPARVPQSAKMADVRETALPERAAPQATQAPILRRRAPTHPALQVAAAEMPAALPPAVQDAPSPRAKWGLEAEGELLQKGRTAMVRGDSEGALAAVEEHAARFPQGRLAEEREALRIQALVAEDRDPEARSALGAFRHSYPNSLLGPALEEAVIGRFNEGTGKSTQSSR